MYEIKATRLGTDLEKRLSILVKPEYANVDDRKKDLETFTNTLLKIFSNKKNYLKEKAISIVDKYIGQIGAKNFYLLAEKLRDYNKEYKIITNNFAGESRDDAREEILSYVRNEISKDAKIKIDFYRKDNGKSRKINSLNLGKNRCLSRDDFHNFLEDNMMLKMHIQEDGIDYSLTLQFVKNKESGEELTNQFYYLMVKPIFSNKK